MSCRTAPFMEWLRISSPIRSSCSPLCSHHACALEAASSWLAFSRRRPTPWSRCIRDGLISAYGRRKTAGPCSPAFGASIGRTSLGSGVMADEKFTRCPGCKTIFRVTSTQLAMRAGQVRCGHCHTVFDGVAQLLSLAPPRVREEPEFDEAALGPPTVTLREAHALGPPPEESPGDAERAEPSVEAASAETEPPPDAADAEAAYAARFSWQEKRTRPPIPTWLYAPRLPLPFPPPAS